jgi:hypothetical protein
MSLLPQPKRAELEISFEDQPTVFDFLDDDAFVTALMGPVGSGKSYGCAVKLMKKALEQKPSPRDNIRYTRWAVVRNTYGELKTTTLKTWTEVFPEDKWGRVLWTPPITHHIRMPARNKVPGLDCEVIFLALDNPKDVRKLLSLNITGYWANEARELGFAVITHLNRRVGRYPPKIDGGPTWRGGFMDTNPMDEDHWYHTMAEKERPRGKYAWHFYKQPAAIFECKDPPPEGERDGCVFSQGRWWKFNPDAENISNLPGGYYEQQIAGSKLDEIRCYIAGQYVYVQEGRPVWPEYDDDAMVGEPAFDPSLPLQIGLDFGLTPAAVFGQRRKDNGWNILHELPMFEMGLERFGQRMLGEIQMKFPGAQVIAWGDPAGEQRDAIYETTAFQYLKTIGVTARPTATNNPDTRREAGAAPMERRNGLTVHRDCKFLRKALSGGYHFKRVKVDGKEFYRDKANKNQFSHIGDAFGYLMLGGGEFRKLTRNAPLHKEFARGTFVAQTDFDVFSA